MNVSKTEHIYETRSSFATENLKEVYMRKSDYIIMESISGILVFFSMQLFPFIRETTYFVFTVNKPRGPALDGVMNDVLLKCST